MRRTIVLIALFLIGISGFAQTGGVKGVIIDSSIDEPLPGANIVLKGTTTGVTTDLDGAFTLEGLDAGRQTLIISYLGYSNQEMAVVIKPNEIIELGKINLDVEAIGLQEVEVIASVAIDRHTPVAVSNIKSIEIQSKVGNQEFPEILKYTPSVYVTKQGGGFGDSRINVRGFDQRNTAVMINGVPVNDMENGWVYWSNWAGLSDVASQIQVQRGLGASKLAVPSVGGTINIITNAAEMDKGGSASVSVGNDNYSKYGLMLSTGLGENGWALTLQGTHTRGDGYADGTMFRGYSYFASISKVFNKKHTLQLTGLGAPQWHHQREYGSYDGVNYITLKGENGLGTKYNPQWGTYEGSDLKNNEFSWRKNFYHKPKIFLNHYWNISDKTNLSTSVYASFGRGGGTGDLGRINGRYRTSGRFKDPQTGVTWNEIESWNKGGTVTDFGANSIPWQGPGETNNPGYTGPFAGQNVAESGRNGFIRRSSMNEHNWYGIISNLSHELNDNLNLVVGIDARRYKGKHYRRLEDLMGLDAYFDDDNINNPTHYVTTEGRADGNEIDYYNDGLVNWLGIFGQLEYSNDIISAFLSLSGSNQGFKRIDYFTYLDSDPEQETDWQNMLGGNVKAGLNYNINDYHNVFINGGVISKQPIFDNVFPYYTNQIKDDTKNQQIYALELGYGLRTSRISGNVNFYNTKWGNRQLSRSVRMDIGNGLIVDAVANFDNIAQLHQGVEVDFAIKATDRITINGMLALGNWRYTDNFNATVVPEDAQYANAARDTILYMKDVKTPDAAQTTLSIGATWEVVKNLKISANYYYADRVYADFDISTDNEIYNPGYSAWKLPSYGLLDAGVYYSFKLLGTNMSWNLNLNNVLNKEYISEAETNIRYDAGVADDAQYGMIGENGSPRNIVYYGFGFTWNTGLTIKF